MKYFPNIVRSEGDPRVLRSGPSSMGASDKLARGLGWFSIGLGLVEIFAARRVTRALGIEGKEPLVRAFGAREIGAGIISLSVDKHVGLWSRVAGDGLDIVTLLAAMRPDNRKRDNVGIALALVLGVTLLDIIGAQGASARHARRDRGDLPDYRDRTGFPRGVPAARAIAHDDAKAKSDGNARGVPNPTRVAGSQAAQALN
jgi:hypothetical protein